MKKIKELKLLAKDLPPLKLPLKNGYLIVEIDGCEKASEAIFQNRPHEYSSKIEEEICRYNSGAFKEKGLTSSTE